MIKRTIFSQLETHLASDQMTILVGPRQVGKTYLMDALRKQLEAKGEKTAWFNLDNEEDKKRFSSQATLISYLELTIGKTKAFVFIDEIQRKENAGLFLKGIFDMHTPYKFIISGSGSLELKANIPESMAGRKQLFTVNPLHFEEFINYKTQYQYEHRLDDFFAQEKEKVTRLLSEFMVFGGYPRIVLADTVSAKQTEMQEIYRSYVDRDIHDLLHLEKTDAFANLLKILASQIGGLINITELSSTIAIDEKTIKHYLYYLEQTYIINKVTPYFRNTRKEITKAPIYYFFDIGLRNWLLGFFGLPEIPPPYIGHVFENVIFTILNHKLEQTPTHTHFWRTRDQAEIDFVLETGLDVIPIEVKHTKLVNATIPRSFRNFLSKYKPKKGYIVHLGKTYDSDIEKTHVSFLSYFDLITSDVGKFL